MIDTLQRGRPGRSASRRYKTLSRAWRDRVFGRRFALYFWTIYSLVVVLVVTRHPGGTWMLIAGICFGGFAASWLLMPDVLMPSSISNWQLGAWGEQNTASELRALKREGWGIAHDVRWGERGNHDHVVAGHAVFVLNSKNVKDSSVTIEGHALRVTSIESGDSYIADRWAPAAEKEARGLMIELDRALGFPVHVYPVLVIWGGFAAGHGYLNDVAVVRGDQLVAWLRARPVDLLKPEKREAVIRAVRKLPRA